MNRSAPRLDAMDRAILDRLKWASEVAPIDARYRSLLDRGLVCGTLAAGHDPASPVRRWRLALAGSQALGLNYDGSGNALPSTP